jgi:hypothetical protein
MTDQNQLLREALEAFTAAQAMSSYGDYASINWQSQQGPTNPAYGGGDCAKHGRWYSYCHCCADDWDKLKKQADRDAVHARDNALRKAYELSRAALSHPAQPAPDAFREAVQEECDLLHIPMPTDAREAVKAAIAANVRIALDPAVSREAQALIDQGKAQPHGAGEAVYWEWRHLSTHPDTVDFGQWSEWKRVEGRSPIHTAEHELNDLRAYIASGYKYELRPLYTTPPVSREKGAVEVVKPFGYLCDWGNDSYGLPRQTVYYGEPGSAIEDDWSVYPKVHHNLPIYTTPPASQHDLQAINTLEQERQKAWRLGYNAGQKAIQQAAQAVPEGWQLVPVEPTSEMISAALRDCGGIGGGSCGEHTGVDGSDFADVWSTMLRAAKGEQ